MRHIKQTGGAPGVTGAALSLESRHLIEALRQSGPLFAHTVRAGFPSPADDYIEQHISLDAHLVTHPEATFFLRVAGDSMQGVGIQDGDLLVVDRSLPATPGRVVIAVVDGDLTVKQLEYRRRFHITRRASRLSRYYACFRSGTPSVGRGALGNSQGWAVTTLALIDCEISI